MSLMLKMSESNFATFQRYNFYIFYREYPIFKQYIGIVNLKKPWENSKFSKFLGRILNHMKT